ncbi:phosphoglycerate mutase family protein [Streptomyces sp. NPDC057545]|uniref:phosphoglycerate mutase family protein n=1 Tax=Streptomyces sp. NPDC057545 TaxID=3346164 RepID=UPI0036AF0CA6
MGALFTQPLTPRRYPDGVAELAQGNAVPAPLDTEERESASLQNGVLVPPNALGALWVVRHGRSTANAAFTDAERSEATGLPIEGKDSDVPLSTEGSRQAQALGRWLTEHHQDLDLVVCSTYARAQQTWQAMAAYAAAEGFPPLPVLIERFQRGHRSGDGAEAATHEAPVPLREMFEVSTHQHRCLVGSLSCRTRPASCAGRVGRDAHRHPRG